MYFRFSAKMTAGPSRGISSMAQLDAAASDGTRRLEKISRMTPLQVLPLDLHDR
jgi:hypothetical protein